MRRKFSSSVRVFYPRFERKDIVKAIRNKLEQLKKKLPLSLVILFGSYAKGNYTVGSDVDILVVYEGEERKDAYNVIKRALDIPRLEPHVYSRDQYEDMKEIIKSMTRGGLVLFRKSKANRA